MLPMMCTVRYRGRAMNKPLKDRAVVKVTGTVLIVAAVLTTLYALGAPAVIIK
ncbi:hypothetical protein GCM10009662_55310 [Catellatospora coxensis]|uniref:Uncharacterized protein n=1 Tax=Catellatospora coxensis TaxID=310354 RepID=A0A8J3P961_9ACTN|nr:hypothetical protein Cco03nite_56110 [Catellatospora coxensis]